jgi:hypothetical protein
MRVQVLAIGVNSSGSRESRSAAYNDSALASSAYDTQGRRWQTEQPLQVNATTVVTASVYIPGSWFDINTSNDICADGVTFCGRQVELALNVGRNVEGKPGIYIFALIL